MLIFSSRGPSIHERTPRVISGRPFQSSSRSHYRPRPTLENEDCDAARQEAKRVLKISLQKHLTNRMLFGIL